MLPITSWSCFSFLCPSYDSLWILVNYGQSKKGSAAMSCLVLYKQTTMIILKNLLSKELRHNRFTKEISEENGCEVFPAEWSSSQLGEVTGRWELKVQELEPEDLTFKSNSAVLAYVKMTGELKQRYLMRMPSLWWRWGGLYCWFQAVIAGLLNSHCAIPAVCSKAGWQWKWNLLHTLSQHDPVSLQQTSIRMFASACDWATNLL